MNIFELFGTIAIKNKDANAAIEDTTKKAERSGSRIQAAFKKIGETSVKIGKPIVAAAAAAATAIAATVESTREYRTSMAQLDAAFKTHGFTVEDAKDTYKRLYAILGETDQSVEAANQIAAMARNTEDLAKWTDICMGVYATFPDSLPIESLAEAANETSKTGKLTGSLADALNWAGINEEDFQKKLDACTSEQERQNLIMNTLFWTYKDASDQYKETGKNVMKANEAQEKLNAAMGKLGDIAEPIVSGVKSWIADMVNAAVPHLESIISAFSNLGTTWSNEVWPMIQKDFKMKLGIDLPDWETFKSNLKTGWETIKEEAEKSVIIQAIIDIPKNYEEIAQNLKNGWENTVKPAIKDAYKALFGVDMPSWEQIAKDLASGWDNTVWPGIQNLFKVSFGVDMPSWADIAASIQSGWNSVLSQIGGLFNIDFGVNTGSFGGGGGATPENGGGRSFAAGLDRVPNDGYIARLHKDEAVLTAAEASVWRGGGSGRVEALLSELVSLFRAGQMIQLDSGILAGQLTPAIDTQLGTITKYKGRGN